MACRVVCEIKTISAGKTSLALRFTYTKGIDEDQDDQVRVELLAGPEPVTVSKDDFLAFARVLQSK